MDQESNFLVLKTTISFQDIYQRHHANSKTGPSGTASCAGIGYPNSCCSTSDNCFVITDTGYGPVGCCPSDTTCGGTISGCDYPNTACADNLGGGCCIPNYICAGVGCKPSQSLKIMPLLMLYKV